MQINELLEQKNISRYRLSKLSGVPYATLSDICSGKAKLEKCSAETVYKIARALGVTMEDLIAPLVEKRIDFELFKSNVCHRLRRLGDREFILDALECDEISKYFSWGWYAESLYLLAMLDYISRINDVPLCDKYDELRKCKLEKPVYPVDVLLTAKLAHNEAAKEEALEKAIPEFKRFNIVECEVRDVV